MKGKESKIAGPAPKGMKDSCDVMKNGRGGSLKCASKPTEMVGGSAKEFCTDEEPKVTKVGSNPDLSAGVVKRFK